MRHYDEFNPKNRFELFLKNNILEKYLLYQTYNTYIEKIYSKLYIDDTDKFYKFDIINNLINSVINNKYEVHEDIKLLQFKDDMIIVFVLDKITIKLYNYQNYKEKKLDKLYHILFDNICKNLEEIIDVNEYESYNFVIITSKTINTDIIICDKLLINAQLALHYLMKFNWNHRDCIIDNIGYDVDKDYYVLFDFEKSRYTQDDKLLKKEYSRDIDSLYSSYRFRNNYS